MSVDYLLHSDGAPQREYARQAAADGVITYSYSTDSFKWIEPESSNRWSTSTVTKNPQAADAQQANYIDTIFGFIDLITGVRFQKVEGQRGEIHLNFVPTLVNKRYKGNFTDGQEIDPVVNTEFYGGVGYLNGYGQMYSYHNQKQYGAIQDIRAIQTTILQAIGVTAPNGDASSLDYTWDDTLMSNFSGGMDSFGATFFFTKDDQAAIQAVLGGPSAPSSPGGTRTHVQRIKEDLMLGTDGVVDAFRLTSKGMILKEDSGTQYDDLGRIFNNYNVTYIANFNPNEGDKILIHRSLLDPETPQFTPSKKLARKFKKTKLSFMYEPNADTYKSDANIYYNGAGKLLMNTNGKEEGLTPKNSPYKNGFSYNSAGINGQIVAFVDPIGPEAIPFQSSWLDFFM